MSITIVIVPGFNNAGPAQWQSLLEDKFHHFVRVQQKNWLHPAREDWVQGIESTVSKITGDVVLVGHSCGAVAITQWASNCDSRKVKGALLVAPADVERTNAVTAIQVQRPLPTASLPFPSKLIYSDNDEHCTVLRSEEMGALWGCKLELVEGGSHFHTEAGYGEWPAAENWIAELAGRALQLK